MRLLFLHSDFIEVEVKQKAIKEADEEVYPIKEGESLVVFTAVEEDDKPIYIENVIDAIKDVANKVKVGKIVLYPYVHLTNKPASPRLAKHILNKLYETLQQSFEVKKAPFGWYKAFTIKVKGHPLSELSKTISSSKKKEEEEISESLKKEEKLKSHFYILTPEGLKDINSPVSEQFKKLIAYETKKVRAYEKEPPHIKLMKELELVDYEPASDSGNMRYYPKGRLIKSILEDAINDLCISYGAHEVETPIMYDFEHPALKNYLNRFPARQYTIKSDDKHYFLRFAACFGQFLIAHDATISYKQLPLKIYELTRYSFRREQSGELAGLKRLRAFTMPDMHTFVKDIEMAKQEFENQLEKSIEFLKMLGLFDNCEVAFRVVKDFYEQNKEWYTRLAKKVGKPILIEMFDERYAYFITKFEFNFIDAMAKASALSTVQIDVENAKNYDITYIDENGERRHPIILHASLSGAIERDIYALLEKEAMRISKGKKGMLPVWLSPVQLRLIPVSRKHLDFVMQIAKKLDNRKVRYDIDDTDDSLSRKIRRAEKEWIPYIAVVGDKEIESNKLSITIRKTGERKAIGIEEIANEIENQNIIYKRLNMPVLLTKRPVFRQRV